MINASGNTLIIDIRDELSFEYGHIDGAVNIPAEKLDKSDLPKDKKLLICCKSGLISDTEAEKLRELGYDAENLEGGYYGWLREKLSKEVVEGFGDGVDGAAGPEYEGEAHLLKFFGRDEGWLAAFDHVGYEVGAAAGEFFGEFFEFFSGADAVGKADFCACVDVTFCSFDGVVDAVDGAAVGAGHDHGFFIEACVDGGADFLCVFFGGDNLLAVHVAAAFRPCLVFEEDAGSAGLFKHLLCADDVQCIAVAGVAVGNDGKVGGVADAGQLFSHFRAGKEADIRLSQAGCGNGVAAHGEGFDACIGCDLGGQCVADARCNDDFSGFKHVSECDSFFCSCFHSKILLREKTKRLMDLDYQIICPRGDSVPSACHALPPNKKLPRRKNPAREAHVRGTTLTYFSPAKADA